MPFKSTSQRAYLALHKPGVAKKFAEDSPKGKRLPYHVGNDGKGPLSRMFGKDK